MRREQAVAQIKGDVIKVLQYSCCPPSSIRRHLPGTCCSRKTPRWHSPDRSGNVLTRRRGSRFAVSWRRPAWNLKTATPLVWLTANAAGDEMRAIIAQSAGRSRRKRGKSSDSWSHSSRNSRHCSHNRNSCWRMKPLWPGHTGWSSRPL